MWNELHLVVALINRQVQVNVSEAAKLMYHWPMALGRECFINHLDIHLSTSKAKLRFQVLGPEGCGTCTDKLSREK